MPIARGLLGIAVLLGLCFALSSARRAIRWRVVVTGIALQVALCLLIFKTTVGHQVLEAVASFFTRLLEFSYAGSELVFGELGKKAGDSSLGFVLAFQALPILIFFAALMAILYHLGIMQVVVYGFARALGVLLRVSGAESMAVTANVVVGITEAPLVVRPYLERMTRSELMALMTGGFATIAGTVFGLYLGFVGEENGPYLIAASVMSAPAAFVTAKLLAPETDTPVTGADFRLRIERRAHNFLDALTTGVSDGLKLALNIGAMLIAFYALIALVNWPLAAWAGTSIEEIFGFLLRPLAWCLGIDWADAREAGTLLGLKISTNELVAFQRLQTTVADEGLSERSTRILTFALCGFANFGSIGVTIGGLSQLVPSRREDISRLALRAMMGGAIASFLTATIAGMFL